MSTADAESLTDQEFAQLQSAPTAQSWEDICAEIKSCRLYGSPATIARRASSLWPVKLTGFGWRGEGSGRGFDFLLKHIAPMIHGTVEVVFFWEGGNDPSGLSIRDGVVTECEVVMSLMRAEDVVDVDPEAAQRQAAWTVALLEAFRERCADEADSTNPYKFAYKASERVQAIDVPAWLADQETQRVAKPCINSLCPDGPDCQDADVHGRPFKIREFIAGSGIGGAPLTVFLALLSRIEDLEDRLGVAL